MYYIGEIMGLFSSLVNLFTGQSNNTRTYVESGENILRQRLEEVFITDYSDCDVRRDISALEIYNESDAVNYDYGLYLEGKPIALFNVIPYRNVYRKKSYRLAKQIAEERDIPHMNFFAHLPNEVSYISERLRENIVKSL